MRPLEAPGEGVFLTLPFQILGTPDRESHPPSDLCLRPHVTLVFPVSRFCVSLTRTLSLDLGPTLESMSIIIYSILRSLT